MSQQQILGPDFISLKVQWNYGDDVLEGNVIHQDGVSLYAMEVTGRVHCINLSEAHFPNTDDLLDRVASYRKTVALAEEYRDAALDRQLAGDAYDPESDAEYTGDDYSGASSDDDDDSGSGGDWN